MSLDDPQTTTRDFRPRAPLAPWPSRIGPYRVVRPLGAGGMGMVYLAEQDTPVRREVALKVVRVETYSDDVIARFASERQALALMEHPNITRVYDAGTTDEGLPYFVMERVTGVPITEYADAHRLPLHDRVRLVLQVCQAVQHAHQKGIIHRDIKPSNVLVTDADGAPLCKVIDFGIARAVERAPDAERLTTTGLAVGTPAYMSPEQLDGGADVDTRADVYALGVLLYELLAGVLPVDVAPRAGWLAGMYLMADAPPPSARFAALDAATRGRVAQQRGTEPAALRRALEGDLDAVLLKALEPERERRYGAASDLARPRAPPARRAGHGHAAEPHLPPAQVRAPAPRRGGVRRDGRPAPRRVLRHGHAAGAAPGAGAAGGAAAAVAGGGADRLHARRPAGPPRAAGQTGRARRRGTARARLLRRRARERTERRRAAPPRRGAAAARRGPDQPGPAPRGDGAARPGGLPVRAPGGARHGERRLAARARARALLAGNAEWARGNVDAALTHFLPFVRISERLIARYPDSTAYQRDLANALSNIGSAREAQGDLAGATRAYRQGLGLNEALARRTPDDAGARRDLAFAYNTLGVAQRKLGDLAGARASHRAELALWRALIARDTADRALLRPLGNAHVFLSYVHLASGDPASALAEATASRDVFAGLVARDPGNAVWRTDLANLESVVAQNLLVAGAPDAALPHVQAGLRLLGVADTSASPRVVRTLTAARTTRGRTLLRLGRGADALPVLRAAVAEGERALARRPADLELRRVLGDAHLALGEVLAHRADTAEAQVSWSRALTVVDSAGRATGHIELRALAATALLHLGSDAAPAAAAPLLRAGYRPPALVSAARRRGLGPTP